MGRGRTWSKEDSEYLEDEWGRRNVRVIAEKLGRTEGAVLVKAYNLGLGSPYMSGEFLSVCQVSLILGVDTHTIADYWIPKCGLKARKVRMINQLMLRIKITNLMSWLKDNQDKWNSVRMEAYGLGLEPKWLRDKRRADLIAPRKRFSKWNTQEDKTLIGLYKSGVLIKDIAQRMGRSESGIQRRVSRLKENGILPKCKVLCKWSEREEAEFRRLEADGLSDSQIAIELGRDRQHIVDHRRNLRAKGLHNGKRMVMSG